MEGTLMNEPADDATDAGTAREPPDVDGAEHACGGDARGGRVPEEVSGKRARIESGGTVRPTTQGGSTEAIRVV